jgi:hypothetical protein
MGYQDMRYYLANLRNDLIKVNTDTKLVYIILISTKLEDATILTLDQLKEAKIEGSLPGLDDCEDIIDTVDKYQNKINGANNPCPACGNEWNYSYCYCCGYPN